jgi:CRP-like cAMP-binding protein
MFQNKLTTIEKVIFLNSVDIFAHATVDQLGQIAGLTEEVQLEPGQLIFREGEPGEALYLLISGRALLQKNGEPVSEIGEREPLGTLGVLDFHPRFYTATAIDHVHALKLNARDFHDLLSLDIEIVKAVFKVLCRRLREGR